MAGPPDVAPPSGFKLWFAGARPRTLPAAIVFGYAIKAAEREEREAGR